jgi:hypothetical protein
LNYIETKKESGKPTKTTEHKDRTVNPLNYTETQNYENVERSQECHGVTQKKRTDSHTEIQGEREQKAAEL